MSKINFNEEPPTAKQINFAKEISRVTGAELPQVKSKSSYSSFISTWLLQYKAECGEATDNPLGAPGELLYGLDCYDYGISPWGSGFFED